MSRDKLKEHAFKAIVYAGTAFASVVFYKLLDKGADKVIEMGKNIIEDCKRNNSLEDDEDDFLDEDLDNVINFNYVKSI